MIGESSIYFIQVGKDGPVKIGVSTQPSNRLASLQASHYERLHLIGLTPGNRWDEEKLQTKLSRFALGREWFAAVPEVFEEITEPIARVAVALDAAVVAREHLQRAIGLLRGSDERGREELARVADLINEALGAEVPA